MKILNWNCQGVNNLRVIPNLRGMAHKHLPNVIFLSKTLTKTQRLESIRVMLRYNSCLAVDVEGRSGDLAVLSKDSVQCQILKYSRNFINVLIQDY